MFVVLPSSADDYSGVERDAKNWFQTTYAPIWKDAEDVDIDKVRSHYANGYRVHLSDGEFRIAANSNKEWIEALKYFGDSWIGSDLKYITVIALSANSAAIRSGWANRNGDGTTFYNCANYVATRTEEIGWQFLDLFFFTGCAQ